MKTMQGPPPANAIGGMSGITTTDRAAIATVDLTPGNYVLVCFVPDAKDGKAHIEHGMVKEFTVK